MTKPRVYSYLRFSDPRQSAGSSIDRQTAYARQWAAAHDLALDESLSMRDEGLSAYHQRHIKQGALGVFLEAVSAGTISPGSVLIVEALDRLSRAEPIVAQAQLAQIINAGITVVTASDGREYNREGLKAQPMDLVYSLLLMIQAHKESETKSVRVKASIRRLCEQWIAGTYRGPINNGHDPAWVRRSGQGWELVEEHVAAVRRTVELFRAGEGATRIIRELNAHGLKLAPKGGAASSIYKLLRLPALYGAKRLEIDGQEYTMFDYYPALMTADEWAELQHLLGDRSRRRGRGDIVGLITGMKRTFCGYCGAAVVAQNLMTRNKRPDGIPQDGHRRLTCQRNAHAHECPVPGTCSVVPVEHALLAWCSDQMNLTAITEGGPDLQTPRARLAKLRLEITQVERQIAKITDALLDDDGPAPVAFARRARDLEAQLEQLNTEATATERELAAVASRSTTPALASAWSALAERALGMDHDARLQIRNMVADTFERIVILHAGADPYANGPKPITIQLISKTGAGRVLNIHRKTGALLDARTTAPDIPDAPDPYA
ncbi:recombinase family protein [Zoogloea oryzae]|nr:recombinase family protein [Zoogloea oryzae]